MSPAESRPSPHVGSKVQPLPQGISSHSRHILAPRSRAQRRGLSGEIPTPERKRRQKRWKTGLELGACQASRGAWMPHGSAG